MEEKEKFYCYILTNKSRKLLYIGYTDNLRRRVLQHEKGNGALFTRKYNVNCLIYFEVFSERKTAKKREKQLKNWHKEWKWNLVKESNPKLEILKIES